MSSPSMSSLKSWPCRPPPLKKSTSKSNFTLLSVVCSSSIMRLRPREHPTLFTQHRRETVWKLRTGSVSWSHEAAQRGEIAHFSALGVTEKRLIRPVQILSRQSLEGEFCEVRIHGVLGSSA